MHKKVLRKSKGRWLVVTLVAIGLSAYHSGNVLAEEVVSDVAVETPSSVLEVSERTSEIIPQETPS